MSAPKYSKVKKRLLLLFLVLTLIFPVLAVSQPQNKYDDRDFQVQYTFKGQWLPDEDPLKIGPENFADLQNWRYSPSGIEPVRGYDNINTTVLSGTSLKIRSGIQLYSPYDVSYTIVQSENTGLTSSQVIENRTTPPTQGDFEAAAIHTDSSGAGLGRFSGAPGGQIAYTNLVDTMIYAGDESPIAALFTSTASITAGTLTNPKDYTDQVQNTLQTASNVAAIGGGNNSSYTKLLIHADGADGGTSFTDSASGSTTHTVTATGVVTDVDAKKFGTASGLFLSSGTTLSVPDHADWNYGTGRFSIDLWVRLNATGVAHYLYEQYDGINDYVKLFVNTNGTVNAWSKSGGSWMVVLTSTTTLNASTWYHIAFIRGWGDNNDNFALCINGEADDTSNTGAKTLPDLSGDVLLGDTADVPSSSSLDGWLDEIRVSKGIASWTSTFTPPARAYSADALDWLVASTRPLEGVKFYVGDGNTVSGTTLTAKEWTGSAWSSLSITDNTTALTTTGTVTWASTKDTSIPRYIEDLYLYWYNFNLTDGDVTIYHVSADKGFSPVVDIWDGVYRECITFQAERNSVYEDYSLEVNLESIDSEYPFAATIGGLTSSDHIIAMFDDRTTAIKFDFIGGQTNITSGTTADVHYWDGSTYVEIVTVVDLTASGTTSMMQSGVISWEPPGASEEFTRTLFGVTGYAYEITFDGTLTDGTDHDGTSIDLVTSVPAQRDINGYKFPFMYKERLFLCNSVDDKVENRCDYSMKYAPDVWNGEDSSDMGQALYFGGNEALTAATQIYNRFGSAIYNTALIFKANSTYALDGDGPDDFKIKTVSTSIGCPAPLTLATAETAYEITQDAVRNIAIWMSYRGPMLFDGSVIMPISGVRKYFDPEKSTCINYDAIENARGWFDPSYTEWNLLLPSGTAQTTNNIWLTYDLKKKQWFRKVPATYPQSGFQVIDDYGTVYIYSSLDTGYLMRLEYGDTWDGSDISYVIKTADVLPTENVWNETLVRQLKIISQMPALSESETVTVSTKYYKNGNTILYTDLDDFVIDPADYYEAFYLVTDAGDYLITDASDYLLADVLEAVRWVRNTQDVNLRGISHQFEFTMTGNSYDWRENFGKRLIGWGMEGRTVRSDKWEGG